MSGALVRLLGFTVSSERDGMTISDVLRRDYGLSRTLMTRIRQEGRITINGDEAMAWTLVVSGDRVEIWLPESPSPGVVPEAIPIEVVYEDDDVLVLNKPPGLVVHPTKGYPRGTLANAVAHYWKEKGMAITVRPVHRLDRDTSGVILFAKNAYADQHLSEQLTTGKMKRRYWALAQGVLRPPEGTIELRIGVSSDPDLREVSPQGQVAITRYRTLEAWEGHCLMEVELLTGRTHQIRAHFSHLGHPLVADEQYGAQPTGLLGRTGLHAKELSFFHPTQRVRVTKTTELPSDFQAALAKLREKPA